MLRRPGDLVLNVEEPITLTTLIQLSSLGDQFQIWNRRDNKLYVGRNSAVGFELEDNGKAVAFTARPTHIFDAILPAPLPIGEADVRISRTEWQDAAAKYYILAILKDAGSGERALCVGSGLNDPKWRWSRMLASPTRGKLPA